jgi:hypothetical protein
MKEVQLTKEEVELILHGIADLEGRKDEWDLLVDSIREKLGWTSQS